MADTKTVKPERAENCRDNLRRVFDAGAVQARVAEDAQLHPIHLTRIVSGQSANPTIGTMEAISIALEIPLETLISKKPPNVDLRIFPDSSETLLTKG